MERLTRYITILFNRTEARRAGSAESAKKKLDAFRNLLNDAYRIGEIARYYTKDMIERGIPINRIVTKREVRESIQGMIDKHTRPDEPQRDYIQALETMMAFRDEDLLKGRWGIMATDAAHPFVIGDAPVVTMERTEGNRLYFGMGFARPNVEVFLPMSPTTCIHALPFVNRTRDVQPPSVTEVNMGQAAFATKHCFGNVKSPQIDAALQPQFGTVRFGITAFNTHHIDHNQVLFDILMGRRPKAA